MVTASNESQLKKGFRTSTARVPVPDIFVNYRAADARFGAAATYELLSSRFGRHRLFLDNQTILPGTSYVSELNRTLESIRVLLVLIGPTWLAEDPDRPGQLLLERDQDWVRREIRRALERDVHVVPVLLDGTRLPAWNVLPQDISQLVRKQVAEIRHHHLGEDVKRLANHLATLIPGSTTAHHVPPTSPPQELPVPLGRFVGRRREMAQLDRSAGKATENAARIVVLCGAPGVGKTALATYWAHRMKDGFPDGQLYVNLRGFDHRAAVDPGQALHGFLTALGVPPKAIPGTRETRAALYRSKLAGRRVLILLDNADSASQVRPLLPGTPSCLVLVTSRAKIPSLTVRESAQHITLDLLPGPDAHQLLTERLSAERLLAEPGIATELLKWCAGLPIAICLIGALADQRPGPLSQVVHELGSKSNRLDALQLGDDDLDLRTIFAWSYRRLSPPARRLFLLLGAHPGPDISRNFCITLCQDMNARQALDELLRSNLTTEHIPGRIGLHALLRAYAAERAANDTGLQSSRTAYARTTLNSRAPIMKIRSQQA